MSIWIDRYRQDEIVESRVEFGPAQLVVHRHRDEDPKQWLYSCHRLGVEQRKIGDLTTTIKEARRLARHDLLQYVDRLRVLLDKVIP